MADSARRLKSPNRQRFLKDIKSINTFDCSCKLCKSFISNLGFWQCSQTCNFVQLALISSLLLLFANLKINYLLYDLNSNILARSLTNKTTFFSLKDMFRLASNHLQFKIKSKYHRIYKFEAVITNEACYKQENNT